MEKTILYKPITATRNLRILITFLIASIINCTTAMCTNNCIIRPATNQDQDAIFAFIRTLYKNEYTIELDRENYPDLQDIEEHYFKKGGEFLVAISQDEIIGTMAAPQFAEGQFLLKHLLVRIDFRSKNVGQALLDQLLQPKDAPRIFYLSTKKTLTPAKQQKFKDNWFLIVAREDLPDNCPLSEGHDLFMKRIVS